MKAKTDIANKQTQKSAQKKICKYNGMMLENPKDIFRLTKGNIYDNRETSIMKKNKTEHRYVEDHLRISANNSTHDNYIEISIRIGIQIREIGLTEAFERREIDRKTLSRKMDDFVNELIDHLIPQIKRVARDCPFGGNTYAYICPVCKKSFNDLYYVDNIFQCRNCGGLVYKKQYIKKETEESKLKKQVKSMQRKNKLYQHDPESRELLCIYRSMQAKFQIEYNSDPLIKMLREPEVVERYSELLNKIHPLPLPHNPENEKKKKEFLDTLETLPLI